MRLTPTILSAVVVTAAIGIAAPAPQGLPAATPSSVGRNAGALAKAVDLYREAVKRDDIRGAVLYVARRGKVVFPLRQRG